MWTVYRLPHGFEIGGGARGQHGTWLTDANQPGSQIPGYVVWDFTAAYVQRQYEVRLNVYNVFDKQYYIGGYNNTPNRVLPGPAAGRVGDVAIQLPVRRCCSRFRTSSTPTQVARFRARIDAAQWVDGNVTSGHQSAQAKVNEQLPEDSVEAREIGEEILARSRAIPCFSPRRCRGRYIRRCSTATREE